MKYKQKMGTRNILFPPAIPPRTSHKKSSHSPIPSPPRYTFSEAIMEENIGSAEEIITKWDLEATASSTDICHPNIPLLFSEDNRKEVQRFVRALADLKSAMHYLVKQDSSSEKLVRAQNLMEIAMKRLEREFYTILKANRSFLDPESVSFRSSDSRASTWSSFSDFGNEESTSEDDEEDESESKAENHPRSYFSETDKASEVAIANLKIIADCMISTGYSKECVYIYKIIRKSLIDETLYYLGVEKLSSSQIEKMDWDVLEVKVKNWMTAVKTAVKTLFYGERLLCYAVFSASEMIRESCFAEIVRDNALTLFSFPESVAKCKKILSPEKMFRFLDFYETISNLWHEIELIYSFDSLSVVRSQAANSLLKLGEAVCTMLTQFEAAIQKDASNSVVPGGGVHPLTRYVMNYLVFLADYSGSLADIVGNWPAAAHPPLPESYFSCPIASISSVAGIDEKSPTPAISARLAWIILVLLCKLDGRAVLYNEHVALSYLFLANNLNYVVSKVRDSNLSFLMGPEWISKHESKVKQYVANYERIGWSKVMESFPKDPTADTSIPEIVECFRRFNTGFEDAYRVQTSWVIPDTKLRNQVKINLSKMIVKVYGVFYEKYRGELKRIVEAGSIVRFAPDDLKNYLSDLFYGNNGGSSMGSRSRSTTSYTSSSPSTSPPSSRVHERQVGPVVHERMMMLHIGE